jgi:hypothetical protein
MRPKASGTPTAKWRVAIARPRAKPPTAHTTLDGLRQAVAAERMRARDLELEIVAAKLEVEDASSAIAEAYAVDNEQGPPL